MKEETQAGPRLCWTLSSLVRRTGTSSVLEAILGVRGWAIQTREHVCGRQHLPRGSGHCVRLLSTLHFHLWCSQTSRTCPITPPILPQRPRLPANPLSMAMPLGLPNLTLSPLKSFASLEFTESHEQICYGPNFLSERSHHLLDLNEYFCSWWSSFPCKPPVGGSFIFHTPDNLGPEGEGFPFSPSCVFPTSKIPDTLKDIIRFYYPKVLDIEEMLPKCWL